MRRFAVAVICAVAAIPASAEDFGALVELQLAGRSAALFGIDGPLAASAGADPIRRAPEQSAADQLLAARSLVPAYVTRAAADRSDEMVPFPPDAPTHLVGCIDAGTAGDGFAPAGAPATASLERIALADGKVETILSGLEHCGVARATAWGTLLVGERGIAGDGAAWEILDPLALTGAAVLDRESGRVSDPAGVARRPALPVIAWAGAALLDSGVLYAGDDATPGEIGVDRDGGTIYKFVPAQAHPGGRIAGLDRSPLVAGRSYALQVSCFADRIQFGQGCGLGNAGWIEVDPASARFDADGLGATAWYRPSDMDVDPLFEGPGARICWANSGRADAGAYGEVLCAVDRSPRIAGDEASAFTVRVSRLLAGDDDFNSPDDVAFQPGTGILYVAEGRGNGDVFACLPDGADRDLASDGCIKLLSLRDASAKPAGIVFSPDGLTLYLSVGHSEDGAMAGAGGPASDDVLAVTGLAPPGAPAAGRP
ncbi:MAG TPA: hypothetical protein PLJ34_09405 [Hyphomicrobiales bacterium]|nr:hypothetical protein [Kaistiaceae bacterium]HQF31648.1 hypothetical protein [Hyphomicrobiales bacterium]